VGDRVTIGAGAKILGDIHIGSDSRIGSNAVVVKTCPQTPSSWGYLGRPCTGTYLIQLPMSLISTMRKSPTCSASESMS